MGKDTPTTNKPTTIAARKRADQLQRSRTTSTEILPAPKPNAHRAARPSARKVVQSSTSESDSEELSEQESEDEEEDDSSELDEEDEEDEDEEDVDAEGEDEEMVDVDADGESDDEVLVPPPAKGGRVVHPPPPPPPPPRAQTQQKRNPPPSQAQRAPVTPVSKQSAKPAAKPAAAAASSKPGSAKSKAPPPPTSTSSDEESDEELSEEDEEDEDDEEDEEDEDDDENELESDEDAEGETDEEVSSTPLTTSRQITSATTPTPLSRLTNRQKSRLEYPLLELPSTTNSPRNAANPNETAEEALLKRAEMARRRKNLTDQRLEEEKQDTINRLLKRQPPKVKGKGAGGGGNAKELVKGDLAAAEGAGDVEMQEEAPPKMIRWVSGKDGIRLHVPGSWLGTPAGRLFEKCTPAPVRRGMVEEIVEDEVARVEGGGGAVGEVGKIRDGDGDVEMSG